MKEIPKTKRDAANSEILKYSCIAAGSSLIPGKGLDPFADSILQYQMISKLEEIYEIDETITAKKFLAVIIDNLSWKMIGDKIIGALKFLPPPFNSAAFIQIVWDFVTTFTIGHAFRKLYETAYKNEVNPDLSSIASLVAESFSEAVQYFISNFTEIIGFSKITLEIVDIDIDQVVKEGQAIFAGEEKLIREFKKMVDATKKAVSELGFTQEEFDQKMKELAQKIGKPSIEMLEAELNIREINGEDTSELREYLTFLKNQ